MADNPLRHRREAHEPNVYQDWGASPAPPERNEDDAPGEDYSAHNLAQEELGIAFHHADGLITVEFYRHLQSVVCPPPYQLLLLLYMSGGYLLEGRDLNQLIPRIRRHRLGELHCFDPNRYAVPGEGPVVYAIVRKSLADIGAEFNE